MVVERSLQFALGKITRDVEQGARRCSDRHVLAAAEVVAIDLEDAMHTDTHSPASRVAADHRDVDFALSRRLESPYRGRGMMAQQRSATAGEHGGELLPERRQRQLGNRIDAAVHSRESPASQRMIDRAAPQPQADQLISRDQSELSSRDRGNRPVRPAFYLDNVPLEPVLEPTGMFSIWGVDIVPIGFLTALIGAFPRCAAVRRHSLPQAAEAPRPTSDIWHDLLILTAP